MEANFVIKSAVNWTVDIEINCVETVRTLWKGRSFVA